MKIDPPFSEQRFDTFDEWVRRACRVMTDHPEFNDTEHGKEGWRGHHFRALCFDKLGRRCRMGADFQRARDEDAFPVWWIWPDQIVSALTAAPATWTGPGQTPHTYSPDYQAMGDCRICGHGPEAHAAPPRPVAAPAPEAVMELDIEATAENVARHIARSEKTSRLHGPTYMGAKAGALLALQATQPAPVGACAADGGLRAAIRFIEQRRDDYVHDHGIYDPETGQTEFPGNGDEYVGELDEIIDGLKALSILEGQANG